MKLVLTLLGVVLLVIAAVYFLVHMKHGIVAGVAGIVLIGAGMFMGRR
jgi:hypothetical protein